MKQATKLFAVVALATSTPAAAGPEHAEHRASQPAPTDAEVKAAVDHAVKLLGVWVPRMLKSGGPACGNVQGKGRRHCPWES
jgi:hypothetical protein